MRRARRGRAATGRRGTRGAPRGRWRPGPRVGARTPGGGGGRRWPGGGGVGEWRWAWWWWWPAGPERLGFCGVWARPRPRRMVVGPRAGVAASGGCELRGVSGKLAVGVCLGLWAWADCASSAASVRVKFWGKGGGLAKAVESAVFSTSLEDGKLWGKKGPSTNPELHFFFLNEL